MGDKLTLLLEVFHKIEKAGGQATLSGSTAGGKSKFKLEVVTLAAPPSVSPSTSSTSGHRHRRRGARARARRNQRAAAHQASLTEAATVCYDDCNPVQHCDSLCIEHSGCDCDPDQEDLVRCSVQFATV